MYFFGTSRESAREIFRAKHINLTEDIFIVNNLYASIANTSLNLNSKRKSCFIFKIQLEKVKNIPLLKNSKVHNVHLKSLEKSTLLLGKEVIGYGYLPDCSIRNNLIQDARWMLAQNHYINGETKMINWRYFQPINQKDLQNYSFNHKVRFNISQNSKVN